MNRCKIFFLPLILLPALTGCQRNEPDKELSPADEVTFNAWLAADEETGETRTSLENCQVIWSSSDSVSIFQGTTGNSKFKLKDGYEGTTLAVLKRTESRTGDAISNNVALYPYKSSAICTGQASAYYIETEFPMVQSGVEGSFGQGTFPAVAVTTSVDDHNLYFKNVFGLLQFRLTGNVRLDGIGIKSRGGEKLSGNGSILCSNGGTPAVSLTGETSDSLFLALEQPVDLDQTETKNFFIALPPDSLKNGFAITFRTEYGTITKTASSLTVIERSTIKRMAPLTLNQDDVVYNKVVFEDTVFRNYAIAEFDNDGDGEVSYAEAQEARAIDLSGKGVTSLAGIEHFTALEKLTCTGTVDNYTVTCGLSSVDLSHNTNLVKLNLSQNFLSTLNLDNNTSLVSLDCSSNNSLTALDLTKLTSLDSLTVWYCGLHSLDLSKNNNLSYINCSSNGIESLVTSNLTNLEELVCASCSLTALSITENTLLKTLNCRSNSLSSLDLSANHRLLNLNCSSNANLTTLTLGSGAMQEINCAECNLSSLDVSCLPYLKYLDCSYNSNLTSLDLSDNGALCYADCTDGQGNTTIYLSDNQIINSFYYDSGDILSYRTPSSITYETVDLGLSVLWYTSNVGASSMEQPGTYFAWADPAIKSTFSPSNCAYYYYDSTYGDSFSKYFYDDGKTRLEPTDDAAYQIMGSEARIPTADEWSELINGTTRQKTHVNGVEGIKFTSNVSGYTDKFIFLPLAGYRTTNITYDGCMYYWSSDVYTDNDDYCYSYLLAKCLIYSSGAVSLYSEWRDYGFSVRAVKDKQE